MNKKRFNIKNSIRTEFAFVFIVIMILTIGGYLVINNLFLQRYYIRDKEAGLISAYELIDELTISSDTESGEFKKTFFQLCSASNLNAAIVTTSLKTVISTTGDNDILIIRLFDHIFDVDDSLISGMLTGSANAFPGERPGDGVEGRKSKKKAGTVILYKNDRYEICTSEDPRIGIDYLELWGNLGNGDIIIMRTALNSIRESAGVSNRFLGYVSFAMIILCATIIWLIAGKITKPIEELAELSERMCSLDFDAKYTSGGNNEIGVLGEHMNELSETLEHTISELKSSNNELKRDIEKKEKINSMRIEFLSNVAHELKTPIALVQGYAEGLKDNVAEDAESRDYYCSVIMDEADKMNKLVKNLMTLNELEFGEDRIDLKRFDINELIRGCIGANELIISQNGIRIDFSVDKPALVWSDEFKTEEVFSNYLSNAIHYCEAPGSGEGEKRIEVRVVEKDGNYRISVFNTGEPIPEESLPRIFDKFYKVDKARTREYGGSGVGLSIVKAIMDALNKECGVKNYDNGVEFWFELEAAG